MSCLPPESSRALDADRDCLGAGESGHCSAFGKRISHPEWAARFLQECSKQTIDSARHLAKFPVASRTFMFATSRRWPAAVAAILFFVVPVARMFGYALLGSAWPPGTTILMHLRLGVAPVPLSDGTGTWAGSAADALALWNAQLTTVRFAWVDDGYTFSTTSDGRNDVRFGNAVFGDNGRRLLSERSDRR